MKIVFLDAFSSKPEDLDWSELQTLGDLVVYNRSAPHEIVLRAADAEAVLTNKVVLDADIISQLPNLKYIGITATGFNIVDIQAAKQRGIVVTNAKNYSSVSVAQHVFALILAFTNRIAEHNNFERWMASPDFCYYDFTLTDLAEKTIGLVGIGAIGEKVAQIAQAFGMNVLVNRKLSTPHPLYKTVELDELLRCSDFVSLHCPLTEENRGFMNLKNFKKMKPNAILINTGRGPLIDEKELRIALDDRLIAGAALDVLAVEPPQLDNPLFGAKNLIVSPHIAWATLEARKRLFHIVAENLRTWQHGNPVNVVLP